ncbi:ribonuclease H-like domain-containing protein [Tanacetum coccineum]
MAGSDDENLPPPTHQAPHTVSTIKLPILKKGEYDIWAMKMEHYLCHTDYHIWEVIQKGNGHVSVSTDTNGVIKVLPPKTAEEILARERERKARTTLLMALPKDHLAKFHKMTDAKDMWDAIKSRFGGNDESKKMQKYILKQQFKGFYVSNSEGLHKGYDRFQSLLSQLEIHGAGVSTEDANQMFLRSLPSSWSQVSLVMRTKPGVDNLSFDDLYNNLRVFESDVKGFTRSSFSAHNVAFVSSESTNSTNDVSTAYGVSTPSGYNLQRENSSSYTNELMYSFFANQSSGPQLDHEDLEQLDEFDLEEMDLKWQTKVECFNCHNTGHYARECNRRRDVGNTRYRAKYNERRPGKQEEPKALVTLDGEGVDWTGHTEDKQENFALMAYNNSGSDTEMSTKDKSGLGYGDQVHNGVLSYENEVFQSVFDSRSSDVEDSHVNDRFVNVEGMHAVPPPMTRNYMPSGPDKEVDDSMYIYGPKQSKTSESNTQTSNFDSCESNSSAETLKSVPEPVVVEPKVVNQPKVWSDDPIIEDYESDSDDEYVIQPSKEQENLVLLFFSHLIRDCDFHKKRMAKQVELNKKKGKGTGQGENRLVNTDGEKAVSAVGGKRETAVKPSAGCNWRPKIHYWNKFSKYNSGSNSRKCDNLQRALKNKGIVNSRCFRHMTGNKAYLAKYQDYNGGPVAFRGSKGYITGKGKIKIRKLDFEDVYFVKEP